MIDSDTIKIALVCCGVDVLEETIVSMKSALIFNVFSNQHIHFIIVTDVAQEIIEYVNYFKINNFN